MNIAYYAIIMIIILVIITFVVAYIVDGVLALSFMLDMWILFIHSLFVLPHQKKNAAEITTQEQRQHCKTVVDMAQIPGRIEISKNIFLVINKNESWKMLWDYRKWQEIHQYLRKYHSYHIWLALKSTC